MPTNELPQDARRIEFIQDARPQHSDKELSEGSEPGVKSGYQGTVHPDDLQGVPVYEILENDSTPALRVKVDGKENYERYRTEAMRAL